MGIGYVSVELAPRPTAVAQARRLARESLTEWDLCALTEDAMSIASELITNAVNAVPRGTKGLAIIIAMHARPDGLRISSWDIGPGHPAVARAAPDAETGRGMGIVAALASDWGWWPTPSGGKVVWADLTDHAGAIAA